MAKGVNPGIDRCEMSGKVPHVISVLFYYSGSLWYA